MPPDDSLAEVIALCTTWPNQTGCTNRSRARLMQLHPRNPPGHAGRKARRFVNDIRNLREQGHTYETIRQALLDAGVSVSLATVRREARRPCTQWELDHAQREPVGSVDAPASGAASESVTAQQAVKATSAAQSEPTFSNSSEPIAQLKRSRPHIDWLSGLLRVIRRLRRAGSVP